MQKSRVLAWTDTTLKVQRSTSLKVLRVYASQAATSAASFQANVEQQNGRFFTWCSLTWHGATCSPPKD